MIRDILIQHGGQPHIGIKDSPGEDLALATLQGTVLRRPNWVCVGGCCTAATEMEGQRRWVWVMGKKGCLPTHPVITILYHQQTPSTNQPSASKSA